MRPETLLFLLIFLACPLMMIFMMRGHGGHGMHGHGSGTPEAPLSSAPPNLGEMRMHRHALDAEIARLEAEEAAPENAGSTRPKTPARA